MRHSLSGFLNLVLALFFLAVVVKFFETFGGFAWVLLALAVIIPVWVMIHKSVKRKMDKDEAFRIWLEAYNKRHGLDGTDSRKD